MSSPAGLWAPVAAQPPWPPRVTQLWGLDVSSYQGSSIDWGAVELSGKQFAFTKATESTNYINPTFATNWAGIRGAGMTRGAYHYAQPDQNSPQAEVEYFLACVGNLEEGDLLALDLEAGSGNLHDWASTWLEYCTQQVGFKPLLYSGAWFLGPHGLTGPVLSQYGLWLAAYQTHPPDPPAGWSKLTIWQYSDTLMIPGVAGGCDGDVFFGNYQDLAAYGAPA
jgi:lysozyme